MRPTTPSPERTVALYARVSTIDQDPENQLAELRGTASRNGWTAIEYVDHGVSGAKERRPALDRLMTDARRRMFDAVITWRLDRFGRNLRHVITAIDDLQARGVTFISLGEGIDLASPSGRLQLHILSALAEFERARIQERIYAGLARARMKGTRLGRKPAIHPKSAAFALATDPTITAREAAAHLNVSKVTINRIRRRHRAEISESPSPTMPAVEAITSIP
jgi:DNA invertase Pin-like site-specific DNA recombinase